MFQECFRKIVWLFQECFRGVVREVSEVFQECLKRSSRKFRGPQDISRVFQRVSGVLQAYLRGVSWMLKWCEKIGRNCLLVLRCIHKFFTLPSVDRFSLNRFKPIQSLAYSYVKQNFFMSRMKILYTCYSYIQHDTLMSRMNLQNVCYIHNPHDNDETYPT